MALRGWKRSPGKAERYTPPPAERERLRAAGRLRSDGTVSRRQYENYRAQKAGWRSWSDYQRERKSDDYNRLLNIGVENRGLTRRDIGVESEFSKLVVDVRRARADNAADLYDPDGPLADLLVYVGLRQLDDHWDVGDTPGAN